MNIEQLYRDYNIPFVTAGGHKHAREGWVNTACPFCYGHSGYHLGYHIDGNKFVCWRCGGHYAVAVISKLLNVNWTEAQSILREYGNLYIKKPQAKVVIKPFHLPSQIIELQNNHIQYLENRGYDVEYLVREFYLQGTGPSSKLGKINYRHRIIIPYFWEGSVVTFDTRDITGKAAKKYLACPDDRELIPRKSILYGRQDKWTDKGIAVEGAFDVFRMGFNSFATSGINYTPAQLRLMKKQFKRIGVLYDGNEIQAKKQANKLVGELKLRGVDAFRIDIDGDPGELPESEAKYIVKQVVN